MEAMLAILGSPGVEDLGETQNQVSCIFKKTDWSLVVKSYGNASRELNIIYWSASVEQFKSVMLQE